MSNETRIAVLHNHYDVNHLAKVQAEMETLGAPTIKAVWMEVFGHWAALEGCHRLRAAKNLGLTPEIEEVEYSDDIAGGTKDDLTVAEICDSSYSSDVLVF